MSTNDVDHLLSKIAVRLETRISGQSSNILGSGVIYYIAVADYIYVFTALHCILGERTRIKEVNSYRHKLAEVEYVLVEHNPTLDSQNFQEQKVTVENIIIDATNDFCILKVDKKLVASIVSFPEIVVHSGRRQEGKFRSSGYLGANRSNYTPLQYNYVDSSPDNILVVNSIGIHSENAIDSIGGYSGSGVLLEKKPILVGIVTKLGNEAALGGNMHVKELSKIDINGLLQAHHSANKPVSFINNAKKIVIEANEKVVDLTKVSVNGIDLNIWKAIGNIKKDIEDDWFQDPLRLRDILYSENVYNLLMIALKEEVYTPEKSETYSIPKEGFTTRNAIQTTFLDRVIYQAVVDFIAQELDSKAIPYNVYSSRYNYNLGNNFDYFFYNSVEQWRKFQYQIHDCLTEDRPYLVVTDITNFYDNISTSSLFNTLSDFKRLATEKQKFEKAIDLLKTLVSKWQLPQNEIGGISQNRDPSAFLANLFLARIDKAMIGQFPNYYRFMDDIRIICKDKFEARRALMILIRELRDLGLNLNSQKTKILNKNDENDRDAINEYTPELDKQIEQICSLMESGKSRDVQISVNMINDMFHESLTAPQDLAKRKKFKFAIERLQRFSRTPLLRDLINFSDVVKAIIERFEDNPWYTEVYVRFLMTVDQNYITSELLNILISLITDDSRNIYPWQSYLTFKLLAYHKINDIALRAFAQQMIQSSQGIEKAPIVAGACIYLASVDADAVDLIKTSLNRGFFGTCLVKRCALICLQTVCPDQIGDANIDDVEREIHRQAYECIRAGAEPLYVKGLPKLKINKISRDLPQVISL